jgi:hypothetical protein
MTHFSRIDLAGDSTEQNVAGLISTGEGIYCGRAKNLKLIKTSAMFVKNSLRRACG